MILRFLGHPRVGLVAILLLLLIPSRDLLARRRGRARPPLGSALFEMWSFADPWGALNGWGIPQHNVDGPRRGGGTSPGSWINYGSSGGTQSRTIDRSRAFPGASSNLSTTLPSSRPVLNAPFRTERRFDPPYFTNYNSYWYHGYWGGGKWGWGRWGGAAGIASFPRWSSGPIYYISGYGQFRNPFVTNRAARPFLDYSRPIEDLEDDDEPNTNSTSTTAGGTAATDPAEETAEDRLRYLVRTPEVKAGLQAFDVADEAFKQKNYELALQKADEALEQLPDDTSLHEFRALILFARGDYQEAAAAIYAVLVVSPGWDWTTLGSRYTDQDEFPRQLRALEAHHRKHPEMAAAAFLRGYHYTSCRHFEAAVKQFQKTAQLVPEDELLPGLVALISGAIERSPSEESPDEPAPSSQSTEQQPEPDSQPIAKTQLVGNWKALRGETTSIQLTVRDDDYLVWTATHEGNPRRIAGRYALVGNLLFLGAGSGALIGQIELKKQGGFMITIPDVSPTNKGLQFAPDGDVDE